MFKTCFNAIFSDLHRFENPSNFLEWWKSYYCSGNSNYQCGENEGDCDNDSDCQANLTCGTDNCINTLATDSFVSSHDCCFDPNR